MSKLQIIRTGPMWASVYVVSDSGSLSSHPIFSGPIADANSFVADYEEGDPMVRYAMAGGVDDSDWQSERDAIKASASTGGLR